MAAYPLVPSFFSIPSQSRMSPMSLRVALSSQNMECYRVLILTPHALSVAMSVRRKEQARRRRNLLASGDTLFSIRLAGLIRPKPLMK
jgi:hypothetical protein